MMDKGGARDGEGRIVGRSDDGVRRGGASHGAGQWERARRKVEMRKEGRR